MRAELTVLIPCKDERLNIRPCLDSVRPIADEILVADSGSIDGTLDTIRDVFAEIGDSCRLIEREYVNSANFKNWAIPQARHEWVLVVDADERVPAELAEEIRTLLADPPANVDGYWIGRLNHFLGYPIRHCGWDTDDVLRLFRRDVGRYEKRWVHAEVELDDARTRQLNASFYHYTTWNTDDYLRKLNRYAAWGAMNQRDEWQRKHVSAASMLWRAPLRFLQLYLLRGGFRDGVPGLQVCAFTAFYSFLKQAKLWEMHHAIPQPNPETERASRPVADATTIEFAMAKQTREAAKQARRAA